MEQESTWLQALGVSEEIFLRSSGDFLETFVVVAINKIYINEELPISQRLGIIALIPKGDKNWRFIENWRPFSLLETLYKLIFATLGNRLKLMIDKIKGPSKMTYIPGSYIAEYTRNTNDLFTYTKDSN